jgi:DNA-binding PadR family transcriptional regulator
VSDTGLVRQLENEGLIMTPKARKDLVELTDKGRDRLARFRESGRLPGEVIRFLREGIG